MMEQEKRDTTIYFSRDGGITWESTEIPTTPYTMYTGSDGFRYVKWNDEESV